MGGGDLNAKKAWHPNTMKNQERVWKAEQAAAEEKKRIVELERERQLERDRADLNKLARSNFTPSGSANDDRLHWMYEKPDKKVQQEEYLLGRAIDKNHDQAGKFETDEIPAVSRRVVGSSMLTASGDTQVDLARKLREDPLLLVKERERAARAALLNNPVQRAKLTELLRKEQESKQKKKKKKHKDLDIVLAEKLHALSGKKVIDLAALLASDDSSSEAGDEKSKKKKKKKSKTKRDAVLESDSEERKHETTQPTKMQFKKLSKSDETKRSKMEYDGGNETKRRKRENSLENKTKNKNDIAFSGVFSDDHQSSDEHNSSRANNSGKNRHTKSDEGMRNEKYVSYWNYKQYASKIQRSKGQEYSKDERQSKKDRYYKNEGNSKDERYVRSEPCSKNEKYTRDDRQKLDKYEKEDRTKDDGCSRSDQVSRHKNEMDRGRFHKRNEFPSNNVEWRRKRASVLSEEEKAAKLAEMVAAGADREKQRERRVADQLAEKEKEDRPSSTQFRNAVRQMPDSLETRIHSNRHYIQRDQRHMNEHFARR